MGLGKCFLDLHKYHCEYLTGQICGRTVPTSSLHGHSTLSSFLDSLGQATAADLLSLACLVPPLSRVTFQAWHGPHLTLLSQHGLLSSLNTGSLFGMQSDRLGSCVVTSQNSFKWKLMCKEIQNDTETMIKITIITEVSLCMMASPSTVLIVVISPLAGLLHITGS